jgi:hypothetical protein
VTDKEMAAGLLARLKQLVPGGIDLRSLGAGEYDVIQSEIGVIARLIIFHGKIIARTPGGTTMRWPSDGVPGTTSSDLSAAAAWIRDNSALI